MNATDIKVHTTIITEYQGKCPDCNSSEAIYTHTSIDDPDGYYASVECLNCEYYEWLGYFGPDI